MVDYKTGSSGLSPREFEQGRRLQLPLYALAARDALSRGEPAEALYWAILPGRPGTLRLAAFEGGPEAAYELARAHVGRIVIGVRSGEYPPEPPPGGCPSYCAASAWCWRYQPGWGDG